MDSTRWMYGLLAIGLTACAGAGEGQALPQQQPDQHAPFSPDPGGDGLSVDEVLGRSQALPRSDGQHAVSETQRPVNTSGQSLESSGSEQATNEPFRSDDFEDDVPDFDQPEPLPGIQASLSSDACRELCGAALEAGCEECTQTCTGLPEACAGYMIGLSNCIGGDVAGGGQDCQSAAIDCALESSEALFDCANIEVNQ